MLCKFCKEKFLLLQLNVLILTLDFWNLCWPKLERLTKKKKDAIYYISKKEIILIHYQIEGK